MAQAYANSPSPASLDDGLLSRSSCLSCRQLKRRCSRHIPRCALCMRVGRVCEYDTAHPIPSTTNAPSELHSASSSHPFVTNRLLTRGALITPGSLTPRTTDDGGVSLEAIFLDSVRCRGEDIAVPSNVEWQDVCGDIPPVIPVEAAAILQAFFASTHTWLPIGARYTHPSRREHC